SSICTAGRTCSACRSSCRCSHESFASWLGERRGGARSVGRWKMNGAHRLRVLVVDDEELARLRLRSLVEECPQPRAAVVGEAANASQALVWLATQSCDAILLDVQMPGRDGTQLAAELRNRDHAPAVAFVT